MNRAQDVIRMAVLGASTFCASGQNAGEVRKLAPLRVNEPIQLDGRLAEAAWKNAPHRRVNPAVAAAGRTDSL